MRNKGWYHLDGEEKGDRRDGKRERVGERRMENKKGREGTYKIHKLKVKTKASTGRGNHVFTSWGISSLCT